MRQSTLYAVLAVSVLLNLFAVGALVGAAVTWTHVQPGLQSALRRRPFRAAAAALPAQDRQRFVQVLHETSRGARDLQQTARDSRRDAARLFVQPEFDANAVNAALTRARDADVAVRARLEQAVVGAAAALPQTERVAIAQALAQGGPLRQPPAAATRPAPSGKAP